MSAQLPEPQKKKDAIGRPRRSMKCYAAALPVMPVLRKIAVSTLLISSVGQTSHAPAANAAIHIYSSGMRCVQTMDSSGKA
jgi:hypothetical protein